MILDDIIKIFEKEIPLSDQEEWDTGGLQVGSRKAKVSKVLFAYDPCHEVVREAAKKKAGLIVTHHPLRMKPWRNLDLDSYDGKTIAEAIRNGIAIYSAHTSHDSSKHSLNRHYAKELGLKNLKPLKTQSEMPYLKLLPANTDLVGDFQNLARQAVFRRHDPFALPVLANEWSDVLVDKSAAGVPHHPLLFGQAAVVCKKHGGLLS